MTPVDQSQIWKAMGLTFRSLPDLGLAGKRRSAPKRSLRGRPSRPRELLISELVKGLMVR